MKYQNPLLFCVLCGIGLFVPVAPALSAPDTVVQTPTINQWPLTVPPGKGDPYAGRVVFTAVPFTDLTSDGAYGFLPVVQVRIGAINAAFLVDTGTISTGISPSLAKRLGLTPKPLLPNGEKNAFGQAVDAVTLPTMQLGDISFNPTLVQVYSDSVWRQLGLSVDGIIGVKYLDLSIVEFDFPRHRLTFLNPSAVTPKLREQAGYGASAYATDIRKDEFGSYNVDLELTKGMRYASEIATLDTGSYVTQISAKAADKLRLSPTGPLVEYGGFHMAQEVAPSRVSKLQVGQLKLSDAPVGYPKTDAPEGVGTVLGMDILSGYKVLLDFPAKKMYLQPVTPPVVTVGPDSKPPTGKTP